MDKEYKFIKRDHNHDTDTEDSSKPSHQDGQVPSTNMAGENLNGKLPRDAAVQHTQKIPTQVSAQCGDDDMSKLLGIFPGEIWEMVIDHLDDPNHFVSLSSSSPYFKNLVESRTVVYLFPKVWEILVEQYEGENDLDSSYNQAVMDDVPATRTEEYEPVRATCSDCGGEKYVRWYSGILNMRLVCRTWSNAIDHYFEKNFLPAFFTPEPNYQRALRDISHDRFCERTTNARRFTPHFSQTHLTRVHRSPFVGRMVDLDLKFEVEPEPGHQQYLNEMTAMLTEWGCHVWHCVIRGYATRHTTSELYLNLRQVLSLMPNLKTLDLDFSAPPYRLPPFRRAEQVAQLRSVISLSPMAQMNQLDRLLIKNLPVTIVNHILRSIGSVTLFRWNVPEYVGDEDSKLPNVQRMFVDFRTKMDFQNFFRSPEQCQVEKLSVDFQMFMDWHEVFRLIVERLRTETLTDFAIRLPEADSDDNMERIATRGPTLRFNLTCVKHLKLELNNFTSLDFILPMRDILETLDVSLSIMGEDKNLARKLYKTAGKDQIIHFIGYFHRPLESNIWTLFQKLKRFRFSCYVVEELDPQEYLRCEWSHSRQKWLRQQQRNQNGGAV